jgi:hypothetical protein
MLNSIASFLLDHPPLDEIGGPVTEVIENYRYGLISKEEACYMLNTKFKFFLEKCYKQQEEIQQLSFEYDS